MSLDDCAGGWVGVNGMSHRTSDMLRLPVRMMFLFFFRTIEGKFLLKIA